jgi:hypothetical protein
MEKNIIELINMSSGIVKIHIASIILEPIPLRPLPTIRIPKYLLGKIPAKPKTEV